MALPAPGPRAILVIDGPVVPDDVPGICARAQALLASGEAGCLVCDVSTCNDADVSVVDALARLRLAVRRRGWRFELHGAQPRLVGLLAWLGLEHALRG